MEVGGSTTSPKIHLISTCIPHVVPTGLLSDCIKVYKSLYWNGGLIGSEICGRTSVHSVVMASWCNANGTIDSSELTLVKTS